MSDETASFIDFMRAHNCGPAIPSEIKSTDKWINYTIDGDPPAKKKGRCKFKIEDMGVGCFTDWRSGEWISYPPKGTKPPKTYTDAEKAEYKAKREANSKAADAEKEAGYKEGAKTAQALYGASKPCLEHPYLIAKKVKPHGIRQHGDKLVIPMYGADGQISSLQTIEPDGEKDYHWKGRKGYYPLAGPEDSKDIILIGEGWATCATAREATGLATICAFDAPSLKPVAKIMRKKYPQARIVIIADNDRGKANAKGEPFNPGIEAAAAAAAAVDGLYIAPEFRDDQAGSDWNDYAGLFGLGLNAVKQKLMDEILSIETPKSNGHDLITMEEIEAQRPPDHLYEEMAQGIPLEYATEYEPAPKANRPTKNLSPVWTPAQVQAAMIWKNPEKDGKPGKLEPNSSHNITTWLRHHEGLNGVFRLDKFSGKIIIHRAPPWESDKKFKVREQDDSDITLLKGWLEKTAGMMPKDGTIYASVYVVAKECFIDPPLDYMEGLVWDQTPRLHKLFSHYFAANKQPLELLEKLGPMWLIGGVARQYRPACKVDNIVVFEGTGGAKKSTALETIASINGEIYFSDGLDFKDLKNKDTIAISRGKLIIEFQELTGMGQAGMDGIIKWLTIKTDECRVPYAKTPQKFERRFLLAGTTNNCELPYHGGLRRFWPVICGEQIDCAGLARDCEQLWAEAVYLFKRGEKWWIDYDDPIRLLVENEQKIRTIESALEQPVLAYLADMRPATVTASKIIEGLNISNSQRTPGMIREINGILADAKWKSITTRIDGKMSRGWKNPDKKTIDAEWTEEQEEIKWGSH